MKLRENCQLVSLPHFGPEQTCLFAKPFQPDYFTKKQGRNKSLYDPVLIIH